MAPSVLVYEDEDNELWYYKWIERIWPRFARKAKHNDTPPGNAWLAVQGFHTDGSGNNDEVGLISQIHDKINPVEVQGAYCIYRMNFGGTAYTAQRAYSTLKGFINVLIFQPGVIDQSDEVGVLNTLENVAVPLVNEGEICVFGNMNANNWMINEPSATVRATAWFALEAKAIKIFQDNNLDWAAHDDRGIVSDCDDILERIAAWEAEGVVSADCKFFGIHSYVNSGWVPALALLGQDAFTRAGVTIPMNFLELAYGFLGQGVSRREKPWLLTDTPGTLAVTWTRLLMRWMRANGFRYSIFEGPMFYDSQTDFSSWGDEFIKDVKTRPAFSTPLPGGPLVGTFPMDQVQQKAYRLRLSNTGANEEDPEDPDVIAANEAAARIVNFWFVR